MPPRKRAKPADEQQHEQQEELVDTDIEQEGVIKLADGSFLDADLQVLRVFSSCARGLPAAAHEWDLSGLRVEGHHVTRPTVAAWLSCIDRVVDGTQPAAAATAAAAGDGDALATAAALTNANGLQQLLTFADAVGSSGGVLQACLSKVEQLSFRVSIGAASWELPATGAALYVGQDQRIHTHRLSEGAQRMEPPFASDQQQAEFSGLLSQQIEGLLYVAHRLQLGRLLELLHGFIFRAFTLDAALLEAHLHVVFSDRVMAAAVGSASSGPAKNAYLSSVLTQACSIVTQAGSSSGDGVVGLRDMLEVAGKPVFDNANRRLSFPARMLQPLLDLSIGDKVFVELCLFNQGGRQTIRFGPGGAALPVQLLLGHAIYDDKQYKLLVAAP